MSLGPEEEEKKDVTFSTAQRTRLLGGKLVNNTVADPVYFILCIGLLGVVIGLLFGISFTWQLYALLAILSIVQIGKLKLKKLLKASKK